MTREYKINECDHIIKIADEKKYYDWKTVWSANKELQNSRNRKNPLLLFSGDKVWEGDVIKLPPKGPPPFKQSLDKDGVYKVPKKQLLCLRLRILKADFSPLKDALFELVVEGGKTYNGKTTDKGFVQQDGKEPEVSNTCVKATLSVQVPPSAAESGADKGGDKKKDKKKAPALTGDFHLKWTLQIGRLNPLMEKAHTKYCISGVQQRLNNLGFYCGPIDGIKGPNTKLSIEKFQSLFGLQVDNIPGTGETQPKLVEIHDSNKPAKIPEGEKKPTKTEVNEKNFIKSTANDIGHVAPDFVDSKEHFFNTLVVAPEYRIKLELGKIEDLFLNKAGTDKGRMERLQVAGLFYFPVNHQRAWNSTDNKAGEAFKYAWKYYCDNLGGSDDKLKEKITNFVVDQGSLPPPAADKDKPESSNFKKIRVPGCYTYISTNSSTFHPNHDDDYKIPMSTENYWKAEEMCLHDNPVLGAIPLVATVESRYGAGGEWKPAQDATVYFQLVEPYNLPDYDTNTSPAAQINCPPLRKTNMQTDPAGTVKTKGPAKHVKGALEKVAKVDGDPQVDNCPKEYGGKRGLAVAGNIFELQADLATHKEQDAGTNKKVDRPGFYAKHENDERAEEVKEPFFKIPEDGSPQGEKFKHSVRAKTNEKGFAAVIFKPSTVGGDRYRLRAFVGPPTLTSDGTDKAAVVVETGTMVVWRNYRISKTIRMQYASISATIQNELKIGSEWRAVTHDARTDPVKFFKFNLGFHKKDGTDEGYHDIDLTPAGDPDSDYDGFIKQMARAFGEVELDPNAATTSDVTDADWRKALKAAIKFAKKDSHNITNSAYDIDVDKLIITDATKVTAANSFVLIPMVSLKSYNAAVANANKLPVKVTDANELEDDNLKKEIDGWFDNIILFPFIHELVNRGYKPGLTMLQMPTISTWHAVATLNDYSIGVGFRACIMRGGKDVFPARPRQSQDPYDVANPYKNWKLKRDGTNINKKAFGYAALTAHEWGHNLFREHAPPKPAPTATDIHDIIADGYCLMTYVPMEGHYCGKCILSLRGWHKIKDLP